MQLERTFICTFGFTEGFLLAMIPQYGLQNGDKIILITSLDSTDKAEQAVLVIKRLVESFKLAGGEIKLEIVKINEIEFENNVITFCKIINDEAKQMRQLILNLSGGMRIIVLAVFLASIYMHKYIYSVNISPENKKGFFDLDIPIIDYELNEKEKKLLLLIENEADISTIFQSMNVNKTTIYRQIARLEEKGFIKATETSNEKKSLTLLGRVAMLEKI